MRGILIAGLSVVALVAAPTSTAMAAPALAKAQPPKPSLAVSPATAKPGAIVMMNVTCTGKMEAPLSGALKKATQLQGAAAPNTVWKATVDKVNPGPYAVGFVCDGVTYKDYLTVQKVTLAKQVKKAPKGSVRTGGGGTAIAVLDGGSGSPTSSGALWAYHDPPRGLPRLAVTYVMGLHR